MSLATIAFAFVGFLALLGVAVLKKLIVDEASGWLRPLSEMLVRRAASRLPRHSDRYEEEWLAELRAFDERRVSCLLYALGIRRVARALRAALAEEPTSAAASTASEILATEFAIDPARAARIVRQLVERTKPDETFADFLIAFHREKLRKQSTGLPPEKIEPFVGPVLEPWNPPDWFAESRSATREPSADDVGPMWRLRRQPQFFSRS